MKMRFCHFRLTLRITEANSCNSTAPERKELIKSSKGSLFSGAIERDLLNIFEVPSAHA